MEGGDILISEALLARRNPLLKAMSRIRTRVVHFKQKAKEFYFQVILSQHECPKCGRDLTMTGPSECSCSCGYSIDPTISFQRSRCCDAKLIRRTFHYACSRCCQVVPSRFLFDEKVFDKAYFREMMHESRARARRRREEIRTILAGSRSDTLTLMEEPRLDSIPDLLQDLDCFVGAERADLCDFTSDINGGFHMAQYREHILSILGRGSRMFSDIAPVIEDNRQDTIRRFVTLIFMQHEGEVALTQYDNRILVERASNETDN